MSILSPKQILKILNDKNIDIEIKGSQIGLPKGHNLSSELIDAIKSQKTEIIQLVTTAFNKTDSTSTEIQTGGNQSSTNTASIISEFSEEELDQVVDAFRLLLAQETKLRSAGMINSINYREVDVRTNTSEKECSNQQVMESKPKIG